MPPLVDTIYMPLELVALVSYSLPYIPVSSGTIPADLLLTYFRYSFVEMEKQLESLPNYHCSPYCSAYSVIECLCPISVPADDNEGICLQYACLTWYYAHIIDIVIIMCYIVVKACTCQSAEVIRWLYCVHWMMKRAFTSTTSMAL